jgi:hypothetical protein
MKKIKAIPYRKDPGHPVMVRLPPEMYEAVKILGGGRMAPGIINILNAFEEQILDSAKAASKKGKPNE